MLRDVLFDLDGTLTDSGEGIINALQYMMDRLGLEPPPPAVLRSFVGPPLVDKVMEEFGLSRADALNAVMIFREYFNEKGIYENALYPGIQPMLHTLQAGGLSLHLATSKPQYLAERILGHFSIVDHFATVVGTPMDESPMSKSEVIGAVLAANGIPPARAAMVGDRKYDIAGARDNNLPAVAVLYGYGAPEELALAAPDYTAHTVDELGALLLRLAAGGGE